MFIYSLVLFVLLGNFVFFEECSTHHVTSIMKQVSTYVAGANESSNEITPEFYRKMVYSLNHIMSYTGTSTQPDVLRPLHSTH